MESRTSNAVGRWATSTQASSLPPLKLLFRQASGESVKYYSKVAAISATNLTEFSSLIAMLISSTITLS